MADPPCLCVASPHTLRSARPQGFSRLYKLAAAAGGGAGGDALCVLPQRAGCAVRGRGPCPGSTPAGAGEGAGPAGPDTRVQDQPCWGAQGVGVAAGVRRCHRQLLLWLLLLCSRGHALAANGGMRFPASQQPATKMPPTRKGIEKTRGMPLPSSLSPQVGFRPAVPCSLPAICWFMAPATPATATGLAASTLTMQRSFWTAL